MPKRKIKRRVKVKRLSATGKCKECGKLYLYCFEGKTKREVERNKAMAKRFVAVQDSELCLTCLTGERQSIPAYEKMQFHVMKGDPLK